MANTVMLIHVSNINIKINQKNKNIKTHSNYYIIN